MLFLVVYFRVKLLMCDVKRNVWGEFLSTVGLEIQLFVFFNLDRFSSVFFFSSLFLSSASFTTLERRYDSALPTS